MHLDQLGPRICILGPSNSGKSTLAVAIAQRLGGDVVHLDQLFHRPGSDWVRRPEAEFDALHARAISGDRWVIEGNYTRLLPNRLERATGLILLDVSTGFGLMRYLRRSWFEHGRHGALAGAKDSVKWDMIHHIVVTTPGNRARYKRLFADIGIPKIALMSRRALAGFYMREGLRR